MIPRNLNEAGPRPSNNDIKRIASLYNYTVTRIQVFDGVPKIYLKPNAKFYPTINDCEDSYGSGKLDDASVQTTSYGSLSGKDLKTYVQGVSSALQLCDYLNNIDRSNLTAGKL